VGSSPIASTPKSQVKEYFGLGLFHAPTLNERRHGRNAGDNAGDLLRTGRNLSAGGRMNDPSVRGAPKADGARRVTSRRLDCDLGAEPASGYLLCRGRRAGLSGWRTFRAAMAARAAFAPHAPWTPPPGWALAEAR
jgi:hypothetical protein